MQTNRAATTRRRQPPGSLAMTEASSVVRLLSRQLELYRELRALARKQRSQVAERETSQLLDTLADRQRIVNSLSEIDREIRPMRQAWPQVREKLSPEETGRVNALIGEVGRTLSEIIDADKQDCEALTVARAETEGQLKSVQTGQQVNNAYAAPRGEHNRFLDESSA